MRLMPSYVYKIQARQMLARTGLEYSIVSIGVFLDYWSHPHVSSVLDPTKGAGIFIDIAHKFAAIPGDGNTPMVFTHSRAAAQFVVAMLDLPSWPRECFFAGDRLTLNEFLNRAQEGEDNEFEVHYDSLENVEAGELTVTPGLMEWMPKEHCKPFAKTMGISYLTGGLDLPTDKCRNDILAHKSYIRLQDMLEARKSTR
jgi:nucleoside-diphosphate-sugar epimerase